MESNFAETQHVGIGSAIALLDACSTGTIKKLMPVFLSVDASEMISASSRFATYIAGSQARDWVDQIRIFDDAIFAYRKLILTNSLIEDAEITVLRVGVKFLQEIREYVESACSEANDVVEIVVEYNTSNPVTEITVAGVGQALLFLTQIASTNTSMNVDALISKYRQALAFELAA